MFGGDGRPAESWPGLGGGRYAPVLAPAALVGREVGPGTGVGVGSSLCQSAVIPHLSRVSRWSLWKLPAVVRELKSHLLKKEIKIEFSYTFLNMAGAVAQC